MKRPIQNSQLLFYGSISTVFAFMLAVNLVFTEDKLNISFRPAEDIQQLRLANKTLFKHKVVPAFKGIRMANGASSPARHPAGNAHSD